MKSVLALSALLFARAVFAQDSLSSVSTPSASPSESLVSVSTTDSANFASSTSESLSASITGSSSSASQTGSAKPKSTSSTAAAAAATGGSYKIPSGISSGCTGFLQTLDADPQFATCTKSLLKATSNFSPGSSAAQNQDTLISTLNSLCSSQGCSDTYMRTQLTNFGTACPAELDPSTGNKSVRDAYDILYIMQPFQDAICTKDNGSYCVIKAPSKSSTSSSSSNDNTGANINVVDDATDADEVNDAINEFYSKGVDSITRRKRADQTVYSPDTETYRDSGVMYLYTLPSLSADSLCTACTQKVLSSYAAWEATVPYAAGLSNSPMLGGQGDLWTQTKKKCGDSFMNVVTSSVGTANAEKVNAGTQVGVSGAVAGAFAVAMGFFVAL